MLVVDYLMTNIFLFFLYKILAYFKTISYICTIKVKQLKTIRLWIVKNYKEKKL